MIFKDISTSLKDGKSKLDGTVELDGKFVCSKEWDALDGQVTCRELGYPNLIHVMETEKNDSDVTGFTDFSCKGNEPNLSKCIHLENNQTCSHKLAAVECSASKRGNLYYL